MLTIKFSKNYKKLPEKANGMFAILRFALPVFLEHQTKHFLEYDTVATDGTVYELPERGQYIILGFTCAGCFFTTIRRFTQEKFDYYAKNVEMGFKIEINEAKE